MHVRGFAGRGQGTAASCVHAAVRSALHSCTMQPSFVCTCSSHPTAPARYAGGFHSGKRHGEGTLYYATGELHKPGGWRALCCWQRSCTGIPPRPHLLTPPTTFPPLRSALRRPMDSQQEARRGRVRVRGWQRVDRPVRVRPTAAAGAHPQRRRCRQADAARAAAQAARCGGHGSAPGVGGGEARVGGHLWAPVLVSDGCQAVQLSVGGIQVGGVTHSTNGGSDACRWEWGLCDAMPVGAGVSFMHANLSLG
jgi:hypothetical protein